MIERIKEGPFSGTAALVARPLGRHASNNSTAAFLPYSVSHREVVTKCGMIGADVRPNWSERPPSESLTRTQWQFQLE
jgi:hypothetical protein